MKKRFTSWLIALIVIGLGVYICINIIKFSSPVSVGKSIDSSVNQSKSEAKKTGTAPPQDMPAVPNKSAGTASSASSSGAIDKASGDGKSDVDKVPDHSMKPSTSTGSSKKVEAPAKYTTITTLLNSDELLQDDRYIGVWQDVRDRFYSSGEKVELIQKEHSTAYLLDNNRDFFASVDHFLDKYSYLNASLSLLSSFCEPAFYSSFNNSGCEHPMDATLFMFKKHWSKVSTITEEMQMTMPEKYDIHISEFNRLVMDIKMKTKALDITIEEIPIAQTTEEKKNYIVTNFMKYSTDIGQIYDDLHEASKKAFKIKGLIHLNNQQHEKD